MAKVYIEIRPEEKADVLKAIKKTEGMTISVAKIAETARDKDGLKYNPHRTRFIIDELLEDELIERIVTKTYNKRYIRYHYKVVK